MSEWKPISTAPEDGEFLVFTPVAISGIYMVGRGWDEEAEHVFMGPDGCGIRGATHWMALPEPPK